MQGFLDIILTPGLTPIIFSARGLQIFKPVGVRINVYYDAAKTQKAFAIPSDVQYYTAQNINISGELYFENPSNNQINLLINIL
ncbi:MAG: hypothetical protein QW255_04590 [Candidatus Bilamarchaeaceae archaeon]